MLNLRPFQIALLGFFVFLMIASLFFITFFRGGSQSEINPFGERVIIWGTLDERVFKAAIDDLSTTDRDLRVIEYVEKDSRSFDDELLRAIAEGSSPDLIILPHSSLVEHRGKLAAISYNTISERTFRDRYIDGSEIFMLSDGVYGIPFAVDPLVMYWNRDIFSSNGLATPPRDWEELTSVTVPQITKRTETRDITQSALAFGEYANISHAKEILSMLFLQAGTAIVSEGGGIYEITLQRSGNQGLPPGEAALGFYTQFANPVHSSYTWSRSFPLDKQYFLSDSLGMYFGFGSELGSIQNENPNLNFDIARVPQGREANVFRNYGEFYAFAIPKASQNQQGAYFTAERLAASDVVGPLTAELQMAPVHRQVIGAGTVNPGAQVVYESALIARGWLDPAPQQSESIFRRMVEDVTSRNVRTTNALNDAVIRLQQLF